MGRKKKPLEDLSTKARDSRPTFIPEAPIEALQDDDPPNKSLIEALQDSYLLNKDQIEDLRHRFGFHPNFPLQDRIVVAIQTHESVAFI